MARNFTRAAIAGALLMMAAPAFAQVPPQVNPLGIDLDPLHIFSPAAPAAAPEAAPAPGPMKMKRHRMMRSKKMMMSKKSPKSKMMMMKKKKMMMKK